MVAIKWPLGEFMSSDLLEHGSRLGKYQVLKHIATGGMGAIYKALDIDLRRKVALKVLPTDLAQNAPVLERFRREARHAAQMHHPNIVTLFEYGYDTTRDLHFLAMEYVRGIDLRQYIEGKGKLHPEE